MDRVKMEEGIRRFLEGIGERFEGMVTGASQKGTWVRIFSPPVEGRGMEGFEGLDIGEKVTVELIETNVERGFIDFACYARGRGTESSAQRA